MNDITLQDRELLAGSTPSQDDLLSAWASIYQAALDDDQQGLETAIGAHSRLLGYKTEKPMRQNRERIIETIQKVKHSIGLKAAYERAINSQKADKE